MPFFVVKAIRSQAETLTLVDRTGFPTRAAAEAAALLQLAARGVVATLLVVEAATADEALCQASTRAANDN